MEVHVDEWKVREYCKWFSAAASMQTFIMAFIERPFDEMQREIVLRL